MVDYSDNHGAGSVPSSIAEMDHLFRTAGVDMTVQACNKAIEEWTGDSGDITHTVAVTCTNQGNPGYDVLVNERLGLSTSVERVLLHGVGCAGGLAIMRTAAQLACAATMRGRPARILCFACELSTPNIRHELNAVANCAELSQVSIAGALFSDAAAAFVLCNDLELHCGIEPVFELLDWTTAIIPGTINELGFRAEGKGYRTVLNRSVPKHAISAIPPTFDKLLSLICSQTDCQNLDVGDFVWALHPGGRAIIDGVQKAMGLTEEQLRATREIYRHRGNSSSPTVLAVLDMLRSRLTEKNFVVAAAFGPGISVEMNCLRIVSNTRN
ncbi:chalcone synthase B, partial [Aureobasidium melanogenum]